MADRIIYSHELDDELRIAIHMEGECDLEALAAIEQWCHRRRVHICREMKAKLDAPAESRVSERG